MKEKWSAQEIEKLKQVYPYTPTKELAGLFNRSVVAIKVKANTLNLKKEYCKEFTREEIQYIKEHYPHTMTENIAKTLGRPKSSIHGKAYCLGIKKTKEFMQSAESGVFIKGSTTGEKTRFKKGQIPPNKGKKMDPELKKRIKHTFFTKGHLPHNAKYDGAISVRHEKNGTPYYWIRLSKANWELLHRHIWMQHNGPIPKGFNIAFKDGNQANCKLENLELISNEELMNRNTIQRYPPELKKAIRLISKIERYETD